MVPMVGRVLMRCALIPALTVCFGQPSLAAGPPMARRSIALQLQVASAPAPSSPAAQHKPFNVKSTHFNAFNEYGPRSDAVRERWAVVLDREFDDAASAVHALNHLRAQMPTVELHLIRHEPIAQGSPLLTRYFVAASSLQTRREGAVHLQEALVQRGAKPVATVAQFFTEARLDATTHNYTVQSPGEEVPRSVPYVSNGTGFATTTTVLRREDALQGVGDRVKVCAEAGGSDYRNVMDMANCAGLIFTSDVSYTRCLLASDCIGERVPVGFRSTPEQLVQACIRIDNKQYPARVACLGTLIDPALLTILADGGIEQCAKQASACAPLIARLSSPCQSFMSPAECSAGGAVKLAEIKARAEQVVSCLKGQSAACVALVPDRGGVLQKVASSAKQGALEIRAEALGQLSDATKIKDAVLKCEQLRTQGSREEALRCFMELASLKNKDDKYLQCVLDPAKKPKGPQNSECIALLAGGEAALEAFERARCMGAQPTLALALGSCKSGLNDVELKKAQKLHACVQAASGPAQIAECALPNLSLLAGDEASLKCVASFSGSPVSAVPSSGPCANLHCLASANTDNARLQCLAPSLGPDAARLAGCLVDAVDGRDAAMCAANKLLRLPPQLERVGTCAQSAAGELDFVMCASGASINEELRIAAQCAASSGGEPFSTLGCAAGRLTARELLKCLSGDIGKEGGCFGPGNDLVRIGGGIGTALVDGIKNVVGALAQTFENVAAGLVKGVENLVGGIGRALGLSW